MLGTFFKKLLFTRQFFYTDGSLEILGVGFVPLSLDFIASLEEMHSDVYPLLKEHVSKATSEHVKRLRMKFPELAEIVPQLYEVYGLGKLELIDLDAGSKHAIVRIHESALPHHKSNTSCSVQCGLIAGFFSGLFGAEVDASVNKCVLKGDDYCEFLVK
ncbi:MAG: V4R domain-containing protein [Candidatus Woesearchaeota archaeon]